MTANPADITVVVNGLIDGKAVPAPASSLLALLGIGLVGLAARRRRR